MRPRQNFSSNSSGINPYLRVVSNIGFKRYPIGDAGSFAHHRFKDRENNPKGIYTLLCKTLVDALAFDNLELIFRVQLQTIKQWRNQVDLEDWTWR